MLRACPGSRRWYKNYPMCHNPLIAVLPLAPNTNINVYSHSSGIAGIKIRLRRPTPGMSSSREIFFSASWKGAITDPFTRLAALLWQADSLLKVTPVKRIQIKPTSNNLAPVILREVLLGLLNNRFRAQVMFLFYHRVGLQTFSWVIGELRVLPWLHKSFIYSKGLTRVRQLYLMFNLNSLPGTQFFFIVRITSFFRVKTSLDIWFTNVLMSSTQGSD